MSMRRRCSLLALLATTLAACSRGGGTVTCGFNDPAFLCGSAPGEANCPQQSAWPKFHHDIQNTGTVADATTFANVMASGGQCRWVFPHLDSDPQHGCGSASAQAAPAKGAFAASPVINVAGTVIYIGSADGTLYAINVADGRQNTGFNFAATQAITTTALVATRDAMDAVFVGASDGHIYGLNSTAAALQTNWPSVPGGALSAPTMTLDGSVYTSSADGLFVGVCPNGVERFIVSTAGTLSSPAEAPDGTMYFGGDDRQLRAVQFKGTLKWTFSTAGPIVASPVYDVETNSIYVADRGGLLFKVDETGRPDGNFNQFTAVGPISSSPALAGAHLYFGSDDSKLYAIRKDNGLIDWSFQTGSVVFSSPAVATDGAQSPIVIVGSDDGNVYFLRDDTTSVTELVRFAVGAPVRSSPAIGSDGTVYVGADDGRVYAIGSPLPQPSPSPAAP